MFVSRLALAVVLVAASVASPAQVIIPAPGIFPPAAKPHKASRASTSMPIKGGALLMQHATVTGPRPVVAITNFFITIQEPLVYRVQGTTNFQDWYAVTNIGIPDTVITLPTAKPNEFFRVVTDSTYQPAVILPP